MTAIAPPDIHDAETLGAARALLDAAADPAAMQREVAGRGRAQRAVARQASASTCSRPRRSSAPRCAALLSAEVGQRAAEGHIGPVNRWFAGHEAHRRDRGALRRAAQAAVQGATTPSTAWSRA